MAKISINIVAWNSLRFLPDCLKSIFSQTYKDFSVLVIDNASIDGSLDYVRKNWPEASTLRNFQNIGFSRAHNQGIKLARDAEYVLVANPDVILEPTFLEELIKAVDSDLQVGSAGGKLLKVYHGDPELKELIKTEIIDSAGIKILKSRRMVDRGEGEKDIGRYNKQEEVFGVSGALVLYRRKALEDVKIRDEYFDENFFAYKEDIDLAWRLRLRGRKAIYVPRALAYHFRGAPGKERQGLLRTIRRVRARSPLVSFYSYRNHFFVLVKNEYPSNFWRHILFILLYESKKKLYFFYFKPAIFWRAALSFWRGLPRQLCKRKIIMASAKADAKEIRKWIK
jgi:GT2 family glycosyltransferase